MRALYDRWQLRIAENVVDDLAGPSYRAICEKQGGWEAGVGSRAGEGEACSSSTARHDPSTTTPPPVRIKLIPMLMVKQNGPGPYPTRLATPASLAFPVRCRTQLEARRCRREEEEEV